MSHLDRTEHIPKFGGAIWYVNKGAGSDTNSGKRPDKAFETIGAGITAASAGDAISVKAGTYTEEGLDLNLTALELWCEIGVVIDPAAGTALTLSGASCKLTGMHKITPAAGATGVAVSGSECHLDHGKIVGGAIGLLITGTGTMIMDYASAMQTTTGYDIQGAQSRLTDCKTMGNAATIGYKINAGADTGALVNCTSVGHQTSGYYIDTGSANFTLLNCSSGHGDGRNVDVDHANVWSDFHYDDIRHNPTTFAGAPTTYNIFRLYGSVRIDSIYGHVETQIAATASTCHLSLYSAGGEVILSKIAGGPDLDGLIVGTLIYKSGDSDIVLATNTSATPSLIEFSGRSSGAPIIVTADADQATYIRLNITAALASGEIDWHCHWEPLSDDGFLEDA